MADAATTGASATGYEAFLRDTGDTSTLNLKAFFPVVNKAGADAAGEGAIVTKGGEEEVPKLAASSSSEGSQKEKEEAAKEGPSSWAEKFSSQCQLDTACGRLDIEFMKKDEAPKTLAIEGENSPEPSEPSEPWTQQVSNATAETLNAVSAKAASVMVALGLAAKKDQKLMTDYFQVKQSSKEEEKSLGEKMAASARSLQASAVSLWGQGPQVKELKQTLITDCWGSENVQEELAVETVPSVLSVQTEVEPEPASESSPEQDCDVDEDAKEDESGGKKSAWASLKKKVKGFMSKFKLPEKAPSCEVPEIDVPSCPSPSAIQAATPSMALFSSCIPGAEEQNVGAEIKEDEKAAEEKRVEENAPTPW